MDKETRAKLHDHVAGLCQRISSELQRFSKAGSAKKLAKLTAMLQQLDKDCQTLLSKSHYAKQAEILSPLLAALTQAQQENNPSALPEVAELARDIFHVFQPQLLSDTCLTPPQPRFRKEVVFLPYKADMWDSLESIWQAAAADTEHCHATVMPIPYAEKNLDGTVRQWHYEIDRFPDYVPVVPYDSIDLSELHPDAIFIHNPYDQYNLITSVEQRFYSQELTKCTENLVYIPYFVGALGNDKEFFRQPGTVYADHVIVESQEVKQIYESQHQLKDMPRDKFLALGSPKYDKVLSTTRANAPIPPEWERIIAGRKVILYNTSIGPQMEHGENINVKLAQILNLFYNREDVVLWWRPHPLLESMIETASEGIIDDYCRLRDQYRRDGWGIYDDTSDLERAIAWSDAYYGDTSSVISLYRKTGKPILFQDLSIITSERQKRVATGINFDVACLFAQNIWAISTQGGLFQINWQTGQVKYHRILEFGQEDSNEPMSFTILCHADGNSILAVTGAGCFWQIDVSSGETKKLSDKIPDVMFTGYFKNENSIVFLSRCGSYFAVYDKEKEQVSFIKTGLPEKNLIGQGLVLGGNIPAHNGRMIWGLYGTDKVAVINPYTLQIEDVFYLKNGKRLVAAFAQQDNVIFFYQDGSAEIGKELCLRQMLPLPEDFDRGDMKLSAYNSWIQTEKMILLTPYEANMGIKVEKKRIRKAFPSSRSANHLNRKGFMPSVKLAENLIASFDVNGSLLKIVGSVTDKTQEVTLLFSDEDLQRYYDDVFAVRGEISERDLGVDVGWLADSLLNVKNRKNAGDMLEPKAGQRIYDWLEKMQENDEEKGNGRCGR